jgi:hypothetical protein
MLSYQQNANDMFLLEGEVVIFETIKGTVLSTTKRSETQIHSSGGTNNTPATMNSTVTVCHEFWVKTKENHEVPVQLRGHDIPLREGQTVTVTQAKKESQKEYVWVSLMNHHSGELHILDSKKLLKNHQPKITAICFISSLVILPTLFSPLKKLLNYLIPHMNSDFFSVFFIIFFMALAFLLIFGILISFSEIFKAIFVTPKQKQEHQNLIQYLQR